MRVIRDTYELPEEDAGLASDDFGWGQPKSSRSLALWLPLMLISLVILAVLIGGTSYVTARENEDTFCISCHTVPETTYVKRGQAAVGGAVAVDLSSFHYQQIRGKGGTIHCIDCHLGDQTWQAHASKWQMTVRHAASWLTGRNTDQPETLRLRVPHLTNNACITCHRNTLLTVGSANHHHNNLPVAYELWKAGAPLVMPPDTRDTQAMTARGLSRYDTTVQCATCHLTHRSIGQEHYIEQTTVEKGCELCHQQTRK
ncbi:MAG: NapC/NirT family cytochrome c [Anaerolineae bacterium]|nr:NapC/NirT family cytochrome c [Anaerolineae bacterium]